ncbi:MAG: alpha/beta hydrolase [Mogibacterium sp.]|nr:alpha/beta hydrolase [Mogibacterium sp.]MBR0342479.1 alpha/beta hydrolase [Oscillospiraceae bacterium]
MKYVEIDNHKMHVFAAGDESKARLVLMSGSGTVAPVYDFKILYEKLVRNFRIIVTEKFGYGYSDLYECPCDIDSVIAFQREALEKAGEKGPYILLPHSMSGLEAIRWKQKYPDEVKAIIGLDMAIPGVYLNWKQKEIGQRIRLMKRLRKLNKHGLLFWYPLSKRGLNRDEIKQQKILLKRNVMNPCYENEAEAILENAKIVDKGGRIECPILMFISDGKQVSSGWINHEREFAALMNAKTVYLNCGHYIHYYESERISQEIELFVNQIMKL